MKTWRLLSVLVLVIVAFSGMAYAQGNGKGNGKGGGNDGGGGDIATNDITARWNGGEVNGTGSSPRDCTLGSDPQPNGTHTAYTCVQGPQHTVAVALSNGTVVDRKGSPSPEDEAACAAGYAFEDAPTTQYVVAVNELCTDDDGCPLKVQNMFSSEFISGLTGFTHVKIVGEGHVSQYTANPNPFACPANADGTPNTYEIHSIQVQVRNGGNKAELVCQFSVTGTNFEVTPVCE